MVKLKHDINDKDLKVIVDAVDRAVATADRMTSTVEKIGELAESTLKKRPTLTIKILGFEVLKAEGGLQ